MPQKSKHHIQGNAISAGCAVERFLLKLSNFFLCQISTLYVRGVWLKPQNRQSWYFAYKFTLPSILVLGPKSSIIWQFFLQIFVGLIES